MEEPKFSSFGFALVFVWNFVVKRNLLVSDVTILWGGSKKQNLHYDVYAEGTTDKKKWKAFRSIAGHHPPGTLVVPLQDKRDIHLLSQVRLAVATTTGDPTCLTRPLRYLLLWTRFEKIRGTMQRGFSSLEWHSDASDADDVKGTNGGIEFPNLIFGNIPVFGLLSSSWYHV